MDKEVNGGVNDAMKQYTDADFSAYDPDDPTTPSLIPQNFTEALDYLRKTRVFGSREGLERVQGLLDRIGNPENICPVIHIAGTNGKGSVSSFCAHVSAVTGRKTGWFTSPFLERFNERIRIIDGREGLKRFIADPRSAEIEDAAFAEVMQSIVAGVNDMLASGLESPTEFELLTAAALKFFANEKCDMVVLETGLGGRLDSTNVVDHPEVTAITALGYDHMDRLGDTLAQIAWEKGGIIKQDRPLILYDPYDSDNTDEDAAAALEVLTRMAREKNAELFTVSSEDYEVLSSDLTGQRFTYQGETYEIRLLGGYQVENAAMAIEICKHIASIEQIREGLKLTRWAGRLEILYDDPVILIDGAHNMQGCTALGRFLREHFDGVEINVMTGMLGDKAHHEMLDIVLGHSALRIGEVYVTQPNFHRAYAAKNLAAEVAEVLGSEAPVEQSRVNPAESPRVIYDADPRAMLTTAMRRSMDSKTPLIVFGSLYLIGEMRPLIREMVNTENKG